MSKKILNKILNKGTCAGGKTTTLNGGKFEELTNIQFKLLDCGFTKKNFLNTKTKKSSKKAGTSNCYYEKILDDYTLVYVNQWV